jgi:hypothetical protein
MSSTHLDFTLRDAHGPLGPTMMHISHDSRDGLICLRAVILLIPMIRKWPIGKMYPLGQHSWLDACSKQARDALLVMSILRQRIGE